MPVHDPIGFSEELVKWKKPFTLSPTLWRGYANTTPLTWTLVRFTDTGFNAVPKSSGIYAFVIRHANAMFPPHGYIAYIGITGRTLRTRYREYLREKARCKRPHIHKLLTRFPDDLDFYFSTTDAAVDLKALETDLLEAIDPPLNQVDRPAYFQQAIAAQW